MPTILQIAQHYFLPHHSNNFRAKALHHSYLTGFIVFFLLLQIAMVSLKNKYPNVLGYATNINTEQILTLLNQERAKADLGPLVISSKLTSAANAKAADMFAKDYWAHVSPIGVTPWQFISEAGYRYLYAGENLAKNFNTSEEVVKALMNSPTHRANMLKPEYKEVGLAILNGRLNGEETTLVIQEFGLMIEDNQPLQEQRSTLDANKLIPTLARSSSQDLAYESRAKLILKSFSLSRKAFLVVTELLLVILFLDSLYIWKNKTVRLNGRSLAHIIFLLTFLSAVGFTALGVIL